MQRADQVRILEVRGGQKTPLEGAPGGVLSGTLRIQALEDRELELEATNRAGTARRSLGLVILRPPEIVAFGAEPAEVEAGQPVRLTWDVRRAARLALVETADGAPSGEPPGEPPTPGDPRSGSLTVLPEGTTTYALVAANDLGRVEQRVTVRVR